MLPEGDWKTWTTGLHVVLMALSPSDSPTQHIVVVVIQTVLSHLFPLSKEGTKQQTALSYCTQPGRDLATSDVLELLLLPPLPSKC